MPLFHSSSSFFFIIVQIVVLVESFSIDDQNCNELLKAIHCLPEQDMELFYDIFSRIREIKTTKLLQAKALHYLGSHIAIGTPYCQVFWSMTNHVLNTLSSDIQTRRRGDGKKKSIEIYREMESSGILDGEKHIRALLPNITTICNNNELLLTGTIDGSSFRKKVVTIVEESRNDREIKECIDMYKQKALFIQIAGREEVIKQLRMRKFDSSKGELIDDTTTFKKK